MIFLIVKINKNNKIFEKVMIFLIVKVNKNNKIFEKVMIFLIVKIKNHLGRICSSGTAAMTNLEITTSDQKN